MAKKVFYSFHYIPDNWRASQVRNIGSIEGNTPVSDNDWESVKKGGDAAIEKWINSQLDGRTCTIVLIGKETAGRKWIDYEITKSWNDGKGVLGIYIHNLKDRNSEQTSKGANPFNAFNIKGTGFQNIVNAYDPPHSSSKDVYEYISNNIEAWVTNAIAIRNKY